MSTIRIPMRGPGGEAVDLWRTIMSHGVASLPPFDVDEDARTLTATLSLPGSRPRTVVASQSGRGHASVSVLGPRPAARTGRRVADAVRHVLALDRDLSGFYASIDGDADLAWAKRGAGRMLRSQSVFEEVVKTICTTNCAWSATERMVGALVANLGEESVGGFGRAFPTPTSMADAKESFYREVMRAGYRGAYLQKLARDVADGTLDLEALAVEDIPDDALFKKLVGLPGVGPYAAAHIMLMIGRHSRPILDSWTRPKYARVIGRKTVTDKAIERRFKRYGPHAGLAFWLSVTRDWVDD